MNSPSGAATIVTRAWRPTWPNGQATLPADEIHLWVVEPETITDPSLLSAYDSLLSAAERDRNRRFVFEHHRHQDLVTRALVRSVLSTYCPTVAPEAWSFEIGPFGRPEIAEPSAMSGLRFNLSHTDGTVVCLVGRERDFGVDVENVARNSATVDIAEHYFSRDEVRELCSWPVEQQPDRFFDYWTLKEAYIKARGLGLQIPLDQFSILRGGPASRTAQAASISINFGPEIADEPHMWQFRQFDLSARHRCAIAVRRELHDLELRLFQTVPMLGGHPARRSGTSGAGSHAGTSTTR